MVSLRRRRLLGLCTGLPDPAIVPSPFYFDDEGVAQFGTSPANRVSVRPSFLTDTKRNEEIANSLAEPDSLNMLGSNSSKHQNDQENNQPSPGLSDQENNQPSPGPLAKRRNRDRKNSVQEHEFTSVRGVYLKNMKWQAAIKVNKKQIHLGTLETPEEATRIYDRAAFVLGRPPNLELPESDKEELKQMKWEQFLEKTKFEICCKRKRKQRDEPGLEDKFNQVEDSHNELGEGVEVGSSSEVVAEL